MPDHRDFAEAWMRWAPGAPQPRWQDYLPAQALGCPEELVFRLVQTDIAFRVAAGLPALLAVPYFDCPTLGEVDCGLTLPRQVELIRWEYHQRRRHGELPSADEYRRRFPEHAEALADLRPEWTCPACRQTQSSAEETRDYPICPHCGTPSPLRGPFAIPPTVCESSPVRGAEGDIPPVTTVATAPSWPLAPMGTPPLRLTPRRLGRYEVAEEIARGGMGSILRARDPELNRELAVKVLRPEFCDRPALVRRFLEEAQITAQLPHPGVVPVHDIGRDEHGLPFLVMKLVRGQTLEALLSARASPGDDLGRWVGIFEQVCHAVAFAHSHGVIHRDLKPANIMVGRFGEVQVMDWGLARILANAAAEMEDTPLPEGSLVELEESDRPETHGVLGTPSYLPPEQASGEWDRVDERADVFGLGGILCAVLTGRPPYDGRNPRDTLRKAQRVDLTEAFARLDGCGADAKLGTLAKECLSEDAEKRPRHAGEVAQRVADYLAGVQERLREAERQRAAAQAEKARLLAERRARRQAMVLLLALLVLGFVGSWIWWQRAETRAAREKRVRGRLAEVQALLEQGRQQVDDTDAWQVVLDKAHDRLGMLQGAIDRKDIGDEVAAEVAAVRAQADEDEKVQDLMADLERIRLEYGDHAGTREGLKSQATAYRDALIANGLDLLGPHSETALARLRSHPLRDRLVDAMWEWWEVAGREERTRLEAVLAAADPEAKNLRTRFHEEFRRRDKAALQRLVGEPEVRTLNPIGVVNLARGLHRAGALDTAEKLLRDALADHPGDFWLNQVMGVVHYARKPPHLDEAARFWTAAVALRPRSAIAQACLGSALKARGDLDGALRCCTRATQLDPTYALGHNRLGVVLLARADFDSAGRSFSRAIELDPRLAAAHNNLGIVMREKKDLDGAIHCCEKALELDPKYSAAHSNLGALLKLKGDPEGAIRCYRKAIQCDPTYALAHSNLGSMLQARGDFEEALEHCRKAVELDPTLHNAQYTLGNLYRARREFPEAIACYRKSIELDKHYVFPHGGLGRALLQTGEFTAAREATQRCLDLLRPEDPQRATMLRQIAECDSCVATESRLKPILRGEKKPVNAAEGREVGLFCGKYLARYRAAVRFYTEAFAGDGKPADEQPALALYNAVCYAAVAADGKGKDAAGLDADEKAGLRKQSLDLIRANLALWARQSKSSDPGERDAARKALIHWQKDPDLSSVRDARNLAILPPDERKAWLKLWEEVAAVLHEDEPPTP
jgi:serine/threonine-protein kinase